MPDQGITLCFAQFVLGLFTLRLSRIPRIRARLQADWPAVLAGGWVVAWLCLRVDLLAALAFPAVVLTLACNNRAVARLMAHPVVYFLGEISFSIYLIHDPCRPLALELLRTLHPTPLSTVPALGFALASALLIIPLAWLAYISVERPGRRVVRGLAAMLVQPAV